MNWRLLVRAGKIFDEIEQTFPDPGAYDTVMRDLKRDLLPNENELRKIYSFMNKWFSRAPWQSFGTFCDRFRMTWNILSRFSTMSLENTSMETLIEVDREKLRLTRAVHYCFDALSLIRKVGSTPASKALHVAAPGLLVMWDTAIRETIAYGSSGYHYAYVFLPAMKESIEDAIQSYVKEKDCDRTDAIEQIGRERGRNYTLAKMIDEFNWITITKRRKLDLTN